LETNPPTYFRVSSERTLDGREITKYVLADNEVGTVARAAAIMLNFMANNAAGIFACFPREGLQERIARKPFVTINGRAICLSKGRIVIREEYRDKYFSDGWLNLPIRCTQGHLLERRSALCWVERMGHFCPVLPIHEIDDLQIDFGLAQEIANFKQEERIWQDHPRPMGWQGMLFPGIELFGKTFLKQIPGLNLGFGVVAGGIRAAKGQWWRAGGEVLSGAAACIPVLGTTCSLALDGCIAVRDIRPQQAGNMQQQQGGGNARLLEMYIILGINPAQNPNPTRNEVDTAWRNEMMHVHLGHLPGVEQRLEGVVQQLTAALNMAREYIYQQRHLV
jgi:hypothetical protein